MSTPSPTKSMKEDPLHRLSRTPTNAFRQQQWAVWKEAESQRHTPSKNDVIKARYSPVKPQPASTSRPSAASTNRITPNTPTRMSDTNNSANNKKAIGPSKIVSQGKPSTNKKDSTTTSVAKDRSTVPRQSTPGRSATKKNVPRPSAHNARPSLKTQRTNKKATTVKVAAVPLKEGQAMELFDRWDENASGKLSLAELDKGIIEAFPDLNHKPAIMRAYKATDTSDDGFVSRSEFPFFWNFLVHYNQLWKIFGSVDEDGDRRISRDEWMASDMDASIFDLVDTNGGGMVLFDELCTYMANAEAHEKLNELDSLLDDKNDKNN